MAITRVNKLGTNSTETTNLSSFSLPVAAATTASNRIIVAASWGAGSGGSVSVTDSQGNIYTQDIAASSTSDASTWGSVFSTRADIPLSTSDTITISWTSHPNGCRIAAYEYSGLANFSPVDQTDTNSGGSNAPSVSATTTHNNELVFGMLFWASNRTLSSPSHTQLDQINGTSKSMETQEDIVSATGTYTISGTVSSVAWAGAIVSYSDTVSGVAPTNSKAPLITGSAVVGMQVTCSQGRWTGIPTAYAYQWKRDGTNLATGAHYLIVAGDVGHTLSCVVSASNKYGASNATASNTVSP